MSEVFSDDYFMKMALQEAMKAYDADEVPVGCVVVCDNKIIGKGYNLTERLHDVTAHAEMQAITAAANHIGAKYLSECRLYVTLEPCVMCAGAIYWARPSHLIFGASDKKKGYRLSNISLHPKTEITHGIMEKDCSEMLQHFFKNKRK